MGSCCSHVERSKDAAFERKHLLRTAYTANCDVGKSETDIRDDEKVERKEGSHVGKSKTEDPLTRPKQQAEVLFVEEEHLENHSLKSQIRNSDDLSPKDEHTVSQTDVENASKEIQNGLCEVENAPTENPACKLGEVHLECSIQKEDSGPVGCISHKGTETYSEVPLKTDDVKAVETCIASDTHVRADFQGTGNGHVDNLLHTTIDMDIQTSLQRVKEECLAVADNVTLKESPIKTGQQDANHAHFEAPVSENVCHLTPTYSSNDDIIPEDLLSTQTKNPEDVRTMMCSPLQTENAGSSYSPEDFTEEAEISQRTESTSVEQDSFTVNCTKPAKTPAQDDEHVTKTSSVSNLDVETKAEEPLDGLESLKKLTSLQDIVHVKEEAEKEARNKKRAEDGKEDLKLTEDKTRNSPTDVQASILKEVRNEGVILSTKVKMDSVQEASEGSSEEDLYRGEEEIKDQGKEKIESPIQVIDPGTQDSASVTEGVDILIYSEKEWRGQTPKSNLIRKGYALLAQRFENLHRVRGDNYCALRATLFQVLCQCEALPAWIQEDDITLLPDNLKNEEEVVGSWRFPLKLCDTEKRSNTTEQLKHCLRLLKNTLQEAAQASGWEERQQLCGRVFQGGEDEYALLEALKFLMLHMAMELYARMQNGAEVPVFCLLLFARDTSETPLTFFANHLSHVGFSGGLEQVEMFLLGYTLHRTIQVYRLYKVDTEEFVTYYPDDHREDWPIVCLVTEDDRHYNVPMGFHWMRGESAVMQCSTSLLQ